MATARAKKLQTDYALLLVTLTLTCLGILLIFDASYARALQLKISPFKYVGQQAIWAIVGIFAMIGTMQMHYRKWLDAAIVLIVASIVMLMLVWAPHIGIAAKGAHRWIGFSALRVQPSELAKLAIVIYIARMCAGRSKMMNSFLRGPLAPLGVVGVIALLVAREPDLGTCLVIVGTGLATLFFAGMRGRHLAAIMAAFAALVFIGVVVKGAHSTPGGHHSFQFARIMTFLNPEKDKTGEGYQIYHSMIALGSGGFAGDGIGMGREKRYIPEPHTDFIFANVGEEGGMIATWFVIALFAIVVGRGLHIASMTRDPFGAILAGGISAGFAFQALINIGVVTASIPATGVPLPFLSYGGSSLCLSLICIGILLSIHRHSGGGEDEKPSPKSPPPSEREFDRRWDRDPAPSGGDYGDASSYRGTPSRPKSRPKAPAHR